MITIDGLWRYPVKSFQGEPVESIDLRPGGVVGDRRWAVRDCATGKILTAKRVGRLLYGSARTEGDEVILSFPGVDAVAATDARVSGLLCDWLERNVELVCARDSNDDGVPELGTNGVYEFNFTTDDQPDAEQYDIPIPAGAFVDLCDAHVITRASVAAARASHPDGDWDIRRLRPTALLGGDGEGFLEDAWVGRSVTLGAATIDVELLTMRCVMPTRAQPAVPGSPALTVDKKVARVISDDHGGNLGVYARVSTAGVVALGDAVTVG